MPDETLIVLTEQAQEIGKLEAETEQQEELLEELEEKVKQLENQNLSDNRWNNDLFTAIENRINNLERELEEWKSKLQAASTSEPEELEESLTEEILTIPIPEVEEPAKEVAKKKGFLNWLF